MLCLWNHSNRHVATQSALHARRVGVCQQSLLHSAILAGWQTEWRERNKDLDYNGACAGVACSRAGLAAFALSLSFSGKYLAPITLWRPLDVQNDLTSLLNFSFSLRCLARRSSPRVSARLFAVVGPVRVGNRSEGAIARWGYRICNRTCGKMKGLLSPTLGVSDHAFILSPQQDVVQLRHFPRAKLSWEG